MQDSSSSILGFLTFIVAPNFTVTFLRSKYFDVWMRFTELRKFLGKVGIRIWSNRLAPLPLRNVKSKNSPFRSRKGSKSPRFPILLARNSLHRMLEIVSLLNKSIFNLGSFSGSNTKLKSPPKSNGRLGSKIFVRFDKLIMNATPLEEFLRV